MSWPKFYQDCSQDALMRFAVRFSATALSGAFFGGSWFISAADYASWKEIEGGPSTALEHYLAFYPKAKNHQVRLAVGSGLAGLGAYLLCKPCDKRYLIAALLMWAIPPYTLVFVKPINNVLLDKDSSRKKDDRWKKSTLDSWNSAHSGRTLLSGVAFSLLLWAAWEKA